MNALATIEATGRQVAPTGLKDKQLAFVVEYCKDKNATQAAIRAGYSAKTAASIGAENLRKPQIRAEIDRGLAEGDRLIVHDDRRKQSRLRPCHGRP